MKRKLQLGTAVILGALAGCTPPPARDSITPHIVMLNPSAAINSWPLAVIEGEIVIEEGCIKVKPGGGGANAVLIFVPSFKLKDLESGWAIVNRHGETWGKIGETRRIGGAIIDSAEVISRYLTPTDRQICPGPYWLVTPDEPVDLLPRNQPSPPVPLP